MLQLEITTKCQASCLHCYNNSGPTQSHGDMTADDWETVIGQAPEAGFRSVQFIGGEPLLNPALPRLIGHALDCGLSVEVYSNLVAVSRSMWDVLAQKGVSLATSYYSDDPAQHKAITQQDGHANITANIGRAVEAGISIRVGIITVLDGQRIPEAKALLADLGVTNVSVDRKRALGRAEQPDVDRTGELCGNCGITVAAVLPDGRVGGCPMSRHLAAGDVRADGLGALLEVFAPHRALIRKTMDACNPPCPPWSLCDPGGDGSCEPATACDPSVCGPDGNADGRLLVLSSRPGCKPESDGNDCSPAETEWEPDE
ncbi:radical SAM protein [Actinocorallia lasiicapitis]